MGLVVRIKYLAGTEYRLFAKEPLYCRDKTSSLLTPQLINLHTDKSHKTYILVPWRAWGSGKLCVHSVDEAPCSRSSTSRLQKNLGLADALVLGWLLTLILPAQTHLLNIPVITLTHRLVLCATVFKWKTKTLPAFADERHHTNSLVTAQ